MTELQKSVALALGTNLAKIKSGENALVCLSGGSNIDYLNAVSIDSLGPNFTICPLDERFTTNPDNNNMSQIINKADHFYHGSVKKGVKFIDTRVSTRESLSDFSERFNKSILDWLDNNPEGKVLITAGIGNDGHISGMKPLPKDKFIKLFDNGDAKQMVTAYDAKDVDPQNPLRVTTTMNFFKRINQNAYIFLYAVGKKEALEKLAAAEGNIYETPARILREMHEVKYFTDIPKFKLE